MMAWIRDKLEPLTDDGYSWSEEDSITWAMVCVTKTRHVHFLSLLCQMYIIPGTAGHSQIYQNLKGEKGKELEKRFSTPIPATVDFGASVFPKGKQCSKSVFGDTKLIDVSQNVSMSQSSGQSAVYLKTSSFGRRISRAVILQPGKSQRSFCKIFENLPRKSGLATLRNCSELGS